MVTATLKSFPEEKGVSKNLSPGNEASCSSQEQPKASHELAQQAGNTNCDFLGVKKGLITGWVR